MFSLPLKGLEIRTPNVESEKHIIALFRPGGYVFRNCEELHLSSNDVETIEAWRRSFSQVLALVSQSNIHFKAIESYSDDFPDKRCAVTPSASICCHSGESLKIEYQSRL